MLLLCQPKSLWSWLWTLGLRTWAWQLLELHRQSSQFYLLLIHTFPILQEELSNQGRIFKKFNLKKKFDAHRTPWPWGLLTWCSWRTSGPPSDCIWPGHTSPPPARPLQPRAPRPYPPCHSDSGPDLDVDKLENFEIKCMKCNCWWLKGTNWHKTHKIEKSFVTENVTTHWWHVTRIYKYGKKTNVSGFVCRLLEIGNSPFDRHQDIWIWTLVSWDN